MKPLIFTALLLLLCFTVSAQSKLDLPFAAVTSPRDFTGSGPTYTGLLNSWDDVYSVGYTGNDAAVGDLFIDATAKIYRISAISAQSFGGVSLTLTSQEAPHVSPSGTGIVWQELDGGLVPVLSGIGSYLQNAIVNHNAKVQSEGTPGAGGNEGTAAVFRDTVLTVTGLVVDVSITGTAPVLSGSPGSYTLTLPDGSAWQTIKAVAASGSGATSGNDLSLIVVNDSDRLDRSTVTVADDAGEVISAPKLEYGITVQQTESGNDTVTTTITNIGALAGFTLYLSQ